MSKWEIAIRTDSRTCRHGEKYFRIHEDIDYHDQPYHTIDSDCFECITPEDQESAQSIIYGMAIIANGAFVLTCGGIDKFITINSSQILYDGMRCSFRSHNFVPAMNPYAGMPKARIDFSRLDIYKAYDLIKLSRAYPPIREILFQIGCFVDEPNLHQNMSSWTILYAIFDTIYFYSGEMAKGLKGSKNEDRVSELLGIGISTLKRFTQTANNFDYLGILSRHGRREFQRPRTPMTLSEAHDFIFNMAMRFIAAFLNNEITKQ